MNFESFYFLCVLTMTQMNSIVLSEEIVCGIRFYYYLYY